MGSPCTYRQTIDPAWSVVEEIREEVAAIMEPSGEELSYASKMVASELVENAVKYGLIDPQTGKGITFDLVAGEKDITIAVTNRPASEEHLANVRKHIEAIAEAGDAQQLYIQRLTMLMEHPADEGSQLGLYRIAYEGGFDLNYQLANDVLTIKARRDLSPSQDGTDILTT